MPLIRQEIYIGKYDWHVTVLYNANLDLAAVAEELWRLGCTSDIALRAIGETITKRNNGFCYTSDRLKSTLICIAETDSDEELINTIVHEAKHLQSHICDYYGIAENGEEAAYLIGDSVEKLYNTFKYELEQS
jgi:hypothetical protein